MKYSELLKQVEMPTFMEAVRLLWEDRASVWKDTKSALTDLFLAFIWIGMILFVWVLWPGVFVGRLVQVAARSALTWAKTKWALWRLGD